MAFRRTYLHRRVVLNLTTGRSFTGVLWAKRGPLLVLRDAAMRDSGQSFPLDGEIVVERHRVEFVQVLATPASAEALA
jgi:hypothetical protein